MINKKNLINYLLSEIDDLEPKGAYYNYYYCDFTNTTVTFPEYNYKELFMKEINDNSEEDLVQFMKRNNFLCESDTQKDINILLSNYNNQIIVADEETQVTDEETQMTDEETQMTDEETQVTDEETQVTDEETQMTDEETIVIDEDNSNNGYCVIN